MHLVVDIGNSLIKTAVFEGRELRFFKSSESFSSEFLELILKSWAITACILSSVRKDNEYQHALENSGIKLIVADCSTPVPINNLYQTPTTLGMDRLAGVTGASDYFPRRDVLVICVGSCLTMDFISSNSQYLGGSISPGLQMRLKALNYFTGKLPLETPTLELPPLTGGSTRQAILSGVFNGMIAEIDGMIHRYKTEYPDLAVVLSGGDIIFFDKKLKNRIFAIDNIVLRGLNKILEYNVQKYD
jgi:type III pantothenate kinase